MTAALSHADRGLALRRTFAAAFAALESLAKDSPSDADRIAATVIAHVRSSRPQAFRADVETQLPPVEPAPVTAVSRELSDSSLYEVSASEGRLRLYIRDASGHDVAPHLNALEWMRLRADGDAVMAGGK